MNLTTITDKTKGIVTLSKLSGYRAYLAFFVGLIVTGLRAQGYIDDNTFQILLATFGSLGLIFTRAAVTTVTK